MTKLGFNKPLFALLWSAGFVGELSTLWINIPLDILAEVADSAPLSPLAIKLAGLVQSVVFLTIATWVGVKLSPKVSLSAPFSEAVVNRSVHLRQSIQPKLIPAVLGGCIGFGLTLIWFAILKPFLPSEFLSAGSQMTVPFMVRLLKGGIAEEIVLRWGLMTFLLWAFWRFLQGCKGTPRVEYSVISILISAIVFGLLHLPAAAILSPQVTPALVLYIVVGNALFGSVAGYLYWRIGLESAIFAHRLFHAVLTIVQSLAPSLST